MSNQEFCINCGQKNIFEFQKPKFCSGCGKPFNQNSTAEVVNSSEDSFDDINIDKLRGSIDVELNAGFVKLDDLWRAPLNPKNKEKFDRKPETLRGNELLKQIEKECGPAERGKNLID